MVVRGEAINEMILISIHKTRERKEEEKTKFQFESQKHRRVSFLLCDFVCIIFIIPIANARETI